MNTPAEYARVAEVYAAVFDLPAGLREARVAEICAGDDTLRRWVEDLLATDDALRTGAEEDPLAPMQPLVTERRPGPRFEAGRVAAGRYRIVSLIGRGGASEVYAAEDMLLEQSVALKFIVRGARAEARAAALLHEVRLARRVRHPNVCQIYDVGEAAGERFISMENVRGANLAEELRRIGRFARPKAVHVAHQLCAGLNAIHGQGVVHGDLKPANVMLDERGDVRILDFGISEARRADDGDEDEGQRRGLIGTPAYVAPERWGGESASVRSDIYALGLVLYEVFSGVRAIRGSDAAACRLEHESDVPAALTSLAEDIDGSVEAIVERCLAKNPQERPKSALEVAAALPGGDGLGGLVFAGILPSAERVAEGGAEKPLARPVIAALALLMIALFAAATVLMPQGYLVESSNLPIAPVALADRADSILRELGHRDLPHMAYGFAVFEGEPEILFWHRRSPRPLEPNVIETSVELADPPFTDAGMVGVVLSPTGDLRSFAAVGTPRSLPGPDAGDEGEDLFRRAGLDMARFTEVAPGDRFLQRGRARAWADSSLPARRVETSEENGAIVYFEVVEAGRTPLWANGPPRTRFRRPFQPFLLFVAIAGVAVAAVLAWRNFRRNAIDRLGARRTAFAVLLLTLGHGLTDSINTGADALHVRNVIFTLQRGAFFASATWVFYAALEPFFRRYWPHALVTWTRLVRGRFTDPIVGRDVLIGACIGFAAVIVEVFAAWLAQRYGSGTLLLPTLDQMRSLAGSWGALGAVLAALLGAVLLCLVQFSLLVLLRSAIGPGVALVLGFAAVLTAGNALSAPTAEEWPSLVLHLAFWCAATPFFLRFGFTTMVTAAFVFLVMTVLPTTLDPAQWYFSTSVAGFLMLLALATFAVLAAARRP